LGKLIIAEADPLVKKKVTETTTKVGSTTKERKIAKRKAELGDFSGLKIGPRGKKTGKMEKKKPKRKKVMTQKKRTRDWNGRRSELGRRHGSKER